MQAGDTVRPHELYCNICNARVIQFEECAEGAVRCPGCRSVGRHRAVVQWLKAHVQEKQLTTGLEIGGNGRFLQSVFGRLVTVDRQSFAVDVVADVVELPFPSGCFDVLVGLDFLEHVEAESAAAAEMARTLAPGGRILLTASLWADRGPSKTPDEAGLPHYHLGMSGRWDCLCYRYYTKDSLRALLEHQGLACQEITIYDNAMAVFGEWLLVGSVDSSL